MPGVITSVLSAAEPFVPFVALPGPARGLCQEVMRATTAAPWAAGAAQRRSATAAAARAETMFSPAAWEKMVVTAAPRSLKWRRLTLCPYIGVLEPLPLLRSRLIPGVLPPAAVRTIRHPRTAWACSLQACLPRHGMAMILGVIGAIWELKRG